MAVWILLYKFADTCIQLIAKAMFAEKLANCGPGLCKAVNFVALTVQTLLFMALSWLTVIDVASRKL